MKDDRLKQHRRALEVAINQALTDSPEIDAAIENIRTAGFDAFLLIEATIGLNQQEAGESSLEKETTVSFKLTAQDERLLKSLKISPK
jgi:hypothetical protein